jgi:hypothetical protein
LPVLVCFGKRSQANKFDVTAGAKPNHALSGIEVFFRAEANAR